MATGSKASWGLRCWALALALMAPLTAFAQGTGQVLDTFSDTTKIDPALSSNYAVSGGRLQLASGIDAGTGADGACLVDAAAPPSVNLSTSSCSGRAHPDMAAFSLAAHAAPGQVTVTLNEPPLGLAPGDELLLLVVQLAEAGQWETRRIASIAGNTLTFTKPLTASYNPAFSKVVVQRVPNYDQVTVAIAKTLTVNPFDGTSGGVVFMRSRGKVFVDGVLEANGKGYRSAPPRTVFGGGLRGESQEELAGSPSPLQRAGAGGGGDTEKTNYGKGGAGGGYGTAGENGAAAWCDQSSPCVPYAYEHVVAQGGSPYGTANLSRLFFGGSGGGGGFDDSAGNGAGGRGGAGGGIVVIVADEISVTRAGAGIRANGTSGSSGGLRGGGGGGGAGGSVLLQAHSLTLGTALVAASGGNGGSGVNGGGAGGVGRIALVHTSTTPSGTTNPPANTRSEPFVSAGSVVSTNLLAGLPGRSRLGLFTYNLTVPPGTAAFAQFSVDGGVSWVDHLAQPGQSLLSAGVDKTLDLAALFGDGWLAQMQVRLSFTSTGPASPSLADYRVAYFSDNTPPTMTGAPAASPNPTNGPVTITWAAASDTGGSGVQRYELESSVNGGLVWKSVATVFAPTTSYTYTPVEGGYLYRVRAVDWAANASVYSAVSPLHVMDTTPPSLPGVPVATPNPSDGTGIEISWGASSDFGGAGFARYELEVSANAGATWSLLASPAYSAETAYSYSPPQGSYRFRVRAVDAVGNASAYSATSLAAVVDTTPPSVPGRPVISPRPSDATGPLTIDWSASVDTGGAGLASYRVERSPDGLTWSFLDSSTTNRYVDANTVSGDWYYRVYAADRVGHQSAPSAASERVVVWRKPVAHADTFDILADTGFDIVLTGTDPEGGELTYEIVDLPRNGVLTGNAPNVHYEPNPVFHGTDSFTFRVKNAVWTSATATVHITVDATNHAPVANAQAVETDEDEPLDIVLTGTDPDDDVLTFEIVTEPLHGDLEGELPNLVYVPHAGFHGEDSFSFVASDGALQSAPAIVTIIVHHVNHAPVAAAQTLSMLEGDTLSVALAATDVDGDELAYVVTSGPAHGTLSGAAPNLVYTPNFGFKGIDSFTFAADDGEFVSNEAMVSIEVLNAPPTLLATVDRDDVSIGQAVQFGGAAFDPGGDQLTWLWVFGDDETSNEEAPSHAFRRAGTYVVTVTVDDGHGGTAVDTLTVVVHHAAPVLQISAKPTRAGQGAPVQFTAVAIQPGSDVLSFHWDFGDGATSTVQNPAHAFRKNGLHTVTARVEDEVGGSDERTIVIDVFNQPPTALIRVLNAAVVRNVPVSLQADASDPGDDELSFAWDFGDGTTSSEQNPQHTWTQVGTYTVKLSVSDGEGGVATVQRKVTVRTEAPVIVSVDVPEEGVSGEPLAFFAEVVAPGNPQLSGRWSWGDGTSDSEGLQSTHTYEFGGSYEITFTVTDDDGAKAVWSVLYEVEGQTLRVVQPGPLHAQAGVALTAALSATGPGAEGELVWRLVSGPGELSAEGVYSWSPDALQKGSFVVEVEVENDAGDTARTTFDVVVAVGDRDGDGVPDDVDNCPDLPNPGQQDMDGDGVGDACDPDIDGDEMPNEEDNCPSAHNPEQEDMDGDGVGDACDEDIDGDGILNLREIELGMNPYSRDSDGDTISDADEIGDIDSPRDTDGDGIIDALDLDSDGDGIPDSEEAGREDMDAPPVDTDYDRVPDYLDLDSDGDGVLDAVDNCRLVENPDQLDTDGNGVGDACDNDMDGDGVPNEVDNCPRVANPDQEDLDDDGVGDACDGDWDGDKVLNAIDNCPRVSNPDQLDSNDNGIGDACDPDPLPKKKSGCSTGGAEGLGGLLILALGALRRRGKR